MKIIAKKDKNGLIKAAKFTGKTPTQRFGMPPRDLGKCVVQNVIMLDPNDAIFELTELSSMVNINFTKEVKMLRDPNIAGKPSKLHKVLKLFTKQYPKWKKSKLASPVLSEPQQYGL